MMLTWRQVKKLILSKILELYDNPIRRVIARWRFERRSLFFDEQYEPVQSYELSRFIGFWRSILDNIHYRPNLFDCDDYAMLFKGLFAKKTGSNAAGIAVGWLCYSNRCGYHAFNVAVEYLQPGEYHVVFIEPQTAEVLKYIKRDGRSEIVSWDGFKYVPEWVIM